MKYLLILFVVITLGCSSNRTASMTTQGPASVTRQGVIEEKIVNGQLLSDSDLEGFSTAELRVLRNACFARHGRKFEAGELADYFASRSWYHPRDDYKDSDITEADRQNVEKIKAAESKNHPLPSSTTQSSSAEEGPSDVQQAVDEVQRIFERSVVSRCGGSYFSADTFLGDSGIAERKNPGFMLAQFLPVTETDKMNGITWKLLIEFRYSAKRRFVNNRWGDWQPYDNLKIYQVVVERRDGRLRTSSTYLLESAMKKISCSEVPH